VKGVFKGKSWLSFEIPEGTVVPASLVVRETGYNQRFKANHYQIECAAKSMPYRRVQGRAGQSGVQRHRPLGRARLIPYSTDE
jgi:hypothetical protein